MLIEITEYVPFPTQREKMYGRMVFDDRYICRAEVNGWWPGKVVNLMMREEGRAMAQVIYPFMVILLKMVVMTLMIKTIDQS